MSILAWKGGAASIAAFLPLGRGDPPPEVFGGGGTPQRATSQAVMTRLASSRGKRGLSFEAGRGLSVAARGSPVSGCQLSPSHLTSISRRQ